MSTFDHLRGKGFKNGQNYVHVVIEHPLGHILVYLETRDFSYIVVRILVLGAHFST